MDSDVGKFTEKVRGWKVNHFSISDEDNDVPRLLRQVADTMEQLGTIDVQDVTFCVQTEGGSLECEMTVYFDFHESE